MSDFATLPIGSEGVGDYHVNRFRIYFRPRWAVAVATGTPRKDTVVTLRRDGDAAKYASQITEDFTDFFNGKGPGYYKQNVAVVQRVPDRPSDEGPTLQFTVDATGPDVHSDWVAIIQTDKNGFGVQTLRRTYYDASDGFVRGGASLACVPFTILGGGQSSFPLRASSPSE